MKYVLILLFWIPNLIHAQINVDKAGDGWEAEVYKALHLIYATSPALFLDIIENVDKVEFWNNTYSSNDGNGIIVIAAKDVKLNSINNLAAVLVHESCHIIFAKSKVVLDNNQEEVSCYTQELEFLQKLSNVEPELIQHAKQQIKNYTK